MNQGEIFRQTIERKKERLEELARQPSGQRFLNHTVLGTPRSLRSSIPFTIVKYGLLTLQDRKANSDTSFNSSNTWDNSCYQPVYFMDDSHDSFRVGSEGRQMLTIMVDPEVLNTKKHYKTTSDSKDLFDSYDGEIGVSELIQPEHILGAIVPEDGHDTLYYFQTKPTRDPDELEKEDKARYKSFDGKSDKGTIWEIDKNHRILGIDSFYRGLLWGMKDFPQNAFPVFSGFSSDHFPYVSGIRNSWTGEVNKDDEIPLEYYLSQQIFPLTQEAYMQQVFVDIARKNGMGSREIGIAQRVARGNMTPEQALGREMTYEESEIYTRVNPNYERSQITAEMASDNQDSGPWKDLDVYERRKLILGESSK